MASDGAEDTETRRSLFQIVKATMAASHWAHAAAPPKPPESAPGDEAENGEAGTPRRQLTDLMEKPKAEVAKWIMDGVSELGKDSTDVEQSAAFSIAEAFATASADEQEKFILTLSEGVAQMPIEDRAIVFSACMRVYKAAPESGGGAMKSRASLTRSTSPVMDQKAMTHMSPLEANILRVVEKSDVLTQSGEDKARLENAAQGILVPAFASTLSAMNKEQRRDLSDFAVEKNLVTTDQIGDLDSLVDLVVQLLYWIERARYLLAASTCLAPVEGLVALVLYLWMPCPQLPGWMVLDMLVAATVAILVWYTFATYMPTGKKAEAGADPVQVAVQAAMRWNKLESPGLMPKLYEMCPGAYPVGHLLVSASLVLVVFSAILQMVALALCLAAFKGSCSFLSVVVVLWVVKFRCVMFGIIGFIGFKIWSVYRAASSLRSSPSKTSSSTYGSV